MLKYQLVGIFYWRPHMITISHQLPDKKYKLIVSALNLMLAKGYYATTIDDICVDAGVTKGSYFHYFKNKEDIAKASLDYFTALQRTVFEEGPHHQEHDAWRKLHLFLDYYKVIADHPDLPNSCLASTFIQELSDEFPDIKLQCEQNFDINASLLEDILLQCQQQYKPIQNFDAKQTSQFFTSLYQGSLLYSRVKLDNAILKQNIDQFRQYINCIFNQSV